MLPQLPPGLPQGQQQQQQLGPIGSSLINIASGPPPGVLMPLQFSNVNKANKLSCLDNYF